MLRPLNDLLIQIHIRSDDVAFQTLDELIQQLILLIKIAIVLLAVLAELARTIYYVADWLLDTWRGWLHADERFFRWLADRALARIRLLCVA